MADPPVICHVFLIYAQNFQLFALPPVVGSLFAGRLHNVPVIYTAMPYSLLRAGFRHVQHVHVHRQGEVLGGFEWGGYWGG